MNYSSKFPPPFRLGPWLVQPDLNRIVGDGGEEQLEPRVMQVLLQMAAHPGDVLSRDQLLESVWGDAIVGEENLTRAISELRRVFSDKPRSPQYIETIRNHGYRLIMPIEPASTPIIEKTETAPVTELESAAAVATESNSANAIEEISADLIPPLEPTPAESPLHSEQSSLRRIIWLILGGLALIAVIVLIVRPWDTGTESVTTSRSGLQSPARPVPFTSFTGREWHPALSPQGSQVAFVWGGPDGSTTNIYIKQKNTESPLKLTSDPQWAAWPAWNPDGQTIAFVQAADSMSAICTVPSIGGPIRQLLTVPSWVEGLDYTPDGQKLVFSGRFGPDQKHRLFFLDLNTLSTEPAGTDTPDGVGDFMPRFSPDGKYLAWTGNSQMGTGGIFVQDLTTSSIKLLSSGLASLQGLAWTSDSQYLVYSAAPAGAFSLWQIKVDGGTPAWIPTQADFAWNPTIARQTGQLIYEQVRYDQDIWLIDIQEQNPWQLETSTFISSTRWEYDASYSPKNDKVVFVSARTGSPEIWVCDNRGENPQQQTFLNLASICNPRWSPDGQQIAFNAVSEGQSVVMVVGTSGGVANMITPPGQSEIFGSWASDGTSLLLGASRDNTWQVVRRNIEQKLETSLTTNGGLIGRESADGHWLYFTKPNLPGLWRQSLLDNNQEPELIIASLALKDKFNWNILAEKIAFVTRYYNTAYLTMYDLTSGHTTPVTDLPGFSGSGLSFSPAGTKILYSRTGEIAGDLLLIDNFAKNN